MRDIICDVITCTHVLCFRLCYGKIKCIW